MGALLFFVFLGWLFDDAENANKKKKSSKRRSSGPSHRARMYRMETGMHSSEWWD